jgi:hypothetical protein
LAPVCVLYLIKTCRPALKKRLTTGTLVKEAPPQLASLGALAFNPLYTSMLSPGYIFIRST